MSCQSCCREPQQVLIERIVGNVIRQLVLDGDLTRWLKCGGGTDTKGGAADIFLQSVSFDDGSGVVTYTLTNGNTYTTDLSALKNHKLKNVALSGHNLTFTFASGSPIEVDLSSLMKDYTITDFSLQQNRLTLTQAGGRSFGVDLSSLVNTMQTDRVVKAVSLDGQTLKVQYGSDSNPNMGELTVSLTDLTGAKADGVTITGDGTTTSPLAAPLSVKDVTKQGDKLVVTLAGGKKFSVALSQVSDVHVKSFEREDKKLVLTETDDQKFEVDLAPLLNQLTGSGITAGSATPGTTAGTELPTTLIGKTRTRLLATPDVFVELQAGGKTYLIPAYEKV